MLQNFFKKMDVTLFVAVVILVLVGLVTIFSTSYGADATNFLNFKKQFVFAIVGILTMIGISFIDYRALKNYAGIFYILALFVLIAVLFSNNLVRGTSSWFDFGFFKFQPSELVKIVVVIIMAKYLYRSSGHHNVLKKIIVSGIYVLLPTLLIMLQPDLGSALVMIFVWFLMVAISGIEKKHIIILLTMGLIVFAGSWSLVFRDYQKERIMTFINPQLDPLGAGYNVIQSVIAVGSGNIWGKGLGYGSQSQLNFLPEKHNDFIFAVIAEAMGFVGTLFVLGLFVIIFHRLFKIAIEAQDNFGKSLILGISFVLIFHVVVNIGMNMGIMPVTGIPLPFISYGGSSMISLMIMMGIAQSVYVRGRGYKIEKEEDQEISF